jgi:hypothetical protein
VANATAPIHSERRANHAGVSFSLLASAALLAILVLPTRSLVAQGTPRVTTVDPDSGKANDTVTLTGERLEKSHVSAVFLSDDKDDFKASVVSQAADKIVIKVPGVKPGNYNVSIQSGDAIFIQPIRFTVQ